MSPTPPADGSAAKLMPTDDASRMTPADSANLTAVTQAASTTGGAGG